jgi:hypothetical protein
LPLDAAIPVLLLLVAPAVNSSPESLHAPTRAANATTSTNKPIRMLWFLLFFHAFCNSRTPGLAHAAASILPETAATAAAR